MERLLNPNSVEDYRLFLKLKTIPRCVIRGRLATFPDEYAYMIGDTPDAKSKLREYKPSGYLFDYQEGISRLAIRKKKFGVFAEPGRGKTAIMFEFAKHAAMCLPKRKRILLISPLMVIKQTMDENRKWYGPEFQFTQVKSSQIKAPTHSGPWPETPFFYFKVL